MKLVLILEDDLERIQRFRSTLERYHPSAVVKIARSVSEFINTYLSLESSPDLISLDHDLFPDSPDDPDPGDGRDAAKFLITQGTKVPVLIHSSNNFAADSMLFSMRDVGWSVKRVAPIGDDWIELDWYSVASKMVKRGNRTTRG